MFLLFLQTLANYTFKISIQMYGLWCTLYVLKVTLSIMCLLIDKNNNNRDNTSK